MLFMPDEFLLNFIPCKEFTAARFIRLRLQRIRTLNADLMLPFQYDLKYLDPTVTNRVSQLHHFLII